MQHDVDLSACLAATRDRFVERIAAWCPVLEGVCDALAVGIQISVDLAEARVQAHKIAGSGRIFGFPDLSRLAAELEEALLQFQAAAPGKTTTETLIQTAKSVVAETRRITETTPDRANGELIRFPVAAHNSSPCAEEPCAVSVQTAHRTAHIMLVDDDDLMRDALVHGLSRHGWRFSQASDGQEAISMLFQAGPGADETPPDVILLDVDMPRMDGFETLRLLKASPSWRHTPVILLTRRTEDVNLIRGMAGGAQDYIPKPFELTALGTKIETVLAAQARQIVIAVGDAELSALISPRIADLGVEVTYAKSPKHAVAETRESRTKLTIIDDGFPPYNGKSVTEMIRADAEARQKPIVSLHSDGNRKAMLQSLRDGDHDSLVVPVQSDELIARIAAILNRVS